MGVYITHEQLKRAIIIQEVYGIEDITKFRYTNISADL